jgi:hypothetical protein
MFKLFSNIFDQSHSDPDRLPNELINTAIERAVDGTDPRVRIVPGYAKTLRRPVIHAIKHVIQLIDSLPEPVLASREDLATHPALAAIVFSAEQLEQIIRQDPVLRDFRKTEPYIPDPFHALLASQKSEKNGFGTALVDGRMRKDVAQTTVNFDEHRFVDPALSEEKSRRLLERRAFDGLLAIALSHLMEHRDERKTLTAQKSVMKAKLKIIGRSGSFEDQLVSGEQGQLQRRLEEVEQQLSELGPAEGVLAANLATIAEVLVEPERHLWLEDKSLCVDRYYVLQRRPSSSAPEITFKEFHNSEGRRLLALRVKIPPE